MYFDHDDWPRCRDLPVQEMADAIQSVLRAAAQFRAEQQAKEEARRRKAEEDRLWVEWNDEVSRQSKEEDDARLVQEGRAAGHVDGAAGI